jgi:hypothetical protein
MSVGKVLPKAEGLIGLVLVGGVKAFDRLQNLALNYLVF